MSSKLFRIFLTFLNGRKTSKTTPGKVCLIFVRSTYVVGLLFSSPWPCLLSLLDFLFLDPLGKTATIVFPFFRMDPSRRSLWIGIRSSQDDSYYTTIFFYIFTFFTFFPQLNVVGLLFSWPWPCLSSLLDFLFLDPLGETAAVVFAFFPIFSHFFVWTPPAVHFE